MSCWGTTCDRLRAHKSFYGPGHTKMQVALSWLVGDAPGSPGNFKYAALTHCLLSRWRAVDGKCIIGVIGRNNARDFVDLRRTVAQG